MKSSLCIIISILCLSCGTIINGTTQQITISSSPEESEVKINGISYGKTPLFIDLERNKSLMFSIEKQGYKTFKGKITRQFSGVAILNIIPFLSPLGLVIDVISGGAYKLSPNSVNINLIKDNESKSYPNK